MATDTSCILDTHDRILGHPHRHIDIENSSIIAVPVRGSASRNLERILGAFQSVSEMPVFIRAMPCAGLGNAL